MTRAQLLESAERLSTPSEASVQEFSDCRGEMAGVVIRAMGDRPDFEDLVGPRGGNLAEDNNRNFPLFMESIMAHFDPPVLVDTALWAFVTYRSHGFRVAFWSANLTTWLQTLEATLSKEARAEIAPFFEWLLTNVPAFTELTDAPDSFVKSAHMGGDENSTGPE